MSTNLQLYEQSAINFLQSCTIIFSPMATQMNNVLLANGIAVDETNPATFKYYLNLSGQYHSSDTMMTIVSLDTKQTVNFTTAMLTSSPKTAAAYTIGSSYYTALCQVYPTQTDLIKSIVYPVGLQAAIDAPDFTLLGWGDGYLEANEQDAILYELRIFIAYITSSWYFPFLSYEAYYTWAFWGIFWQSLPNAIFAARLKYLHTSSVNSFHIWSYLQSHGIGDYSDILTSQQALFLYRNLNYLQQNRGKQSTLVTLVNELLGSLSVGLVGKTIYMNTATNAADCIWTPEFVSSIIPTNNAQSLQLIAPETMTLLNADLVAARIDLSSDPTYVAQQQTMIGRTPLNILTTKLVEIQKLSVDQKYGALLNNFILDTLTWAITSGLYTPTVDITDPTTKLTVSLSGKDALALYYYTIQRSGRQTPTELPTVYAPTCAFQPNLTTASFPQSFSYNGYDYPTKSYLSLDMMLTGLGYPSSVILDPMVFSTLVADLFLVLLTYVRYGRIEANKIALEMFRSYCNTVALQTTPYSFTLSPTPDYPTWTTDLKLTTLFNKLDVLVDYTTAYTSLSTAICTALIPENSAVYTLYAYTNTATDNLYDRMRDLFVQLCSYNIAFLDTNRVNAWWMLYERVVYTISHISDELTWNLTETGVSVSQLQITGSVPLPSTKSHVEVSLGETTVYPIEVNDNETASFTQTDITRLHMHDFPDITLGQQTDVITIPFQIGLGFSLISPTT